MGNGLSNIFRARFEGKHNMMLATIDANSTQYIIHTPNLNRPSVNGASPSRIVHFTEYQHTTILALYVVLQFVGLITSECYHCSRVLCSCTQSALKAFVGYSHMLRVESLQSCKFGVSIIDITNLTNEPSIAISMRILDFCLTAVLQRQYHILHVQHVQHGQQRIGLLHCRSQ